MVNKKQTSPKVAKIASKLLSSPNTSKAVKTVAASDLSQTKSSKKKGK